MKRLRKTLKYAVIILCVLLVVAVSVGIRFLFKNDAPIVTGDVKYGIKYKNDLKLDLYLPTNIKFDSSPVVFFLHGGAWVRGTKASVNFNRINGAINTLRDEGYTIISPDYSLAGRERNVFPDCIIDIYDAIEWMKTHATTYNLDTANVGLLGESAGAHIAMMIAFPDTTLLPDKYEKSTFNYLVDIYGPNDLTDIYRGKLMARIEASFQKVSRVVGSTFDPKQYLLGFDPTQDSIRTYEFLKQYSPIHSVSANEPPTLIIHGESDQIVPVAQSIFLKSKLDSAGVSNELLLLPNVDHNFWKSTPDQHDLIQRQVSDFVMRHYRSIR